MSYLRAVVLLPVLLLSTPLPVLPRNSGPLDRFRSCLLTHGIPRTRIISRAGRAWNQYNYYNYQWNQYYEEKFPLAYVLPETVGAVQAAVGCGSAHDVQVVAKSGGHSYPKYSFGNRKSVILDLQKLDRLVLDAPRRTVEVGPGVLSGPLSAVLLSSGLTFPYGFPSVGLALCLGGGHSIISKRFGLTMDGLLELDVVDSDGDLRTASQRRHKDLFWALRGAGSSGSFGIVTRFKFKVAPAPAKVVLGTSYYDLSAFPPVFLAFQAYCKSRPPKDINFALTINQTKVELRVSQIVDVGSKATTSRVQSILSSEFPPTKSTSVETYEFGDFMKVGWPGDLNDVSRHDYGPISFKSSSFYVKILVNETRVQMIDALLQGIPKYMLVEFHELGGAINELSSTDTAFVHRYPNMYRVRADYTGPAGGGRRGKTERRNIRWMREFFQLTKSLLEHTESYQNYTDDELEDYLERYYAQNLRRLRAIKSDFDPTNYFNTNPQSIPPL